jgi:hypothetical protein
LLDEMAERFCKARAVSDPLGPPRDFGTAQGKPHGYGANAGVSTSARAQLSQNRALGFAAECDLPPR